MTIDNEFELGIPTHISCVLHNNDAVDVKLLEIITKECKNYVLESNDFYSVKVNDLLKAFQKRRK